MTKSQIIDFIRYEYIVYIHLLETNNVSEILLTKDDFIDENTVSDQVKWVPAENLNVDLVDTTENVVNGKETSTPGIKYRICGIFDAEPLDWKYAKITIDDINIEHNVVIARMPRSPIVPVIFDMIK